MTSASHSLRQPLEFFTARGPLSATKFVLTLSMALSGMTVLPSFNWGVTSTDSHLIGVYEISAQKTKQRTWSNVPWLRRKCP